MELIKKMIVTSLGTGYLPVAPGTYASALTAAVGTGMVVTTSRTSAAWISAAAGAVCFILSLILAPYSAQHFGSEDPSEHVIDEVSGQFVALAIAYGFAAESVAAWSIAVLGFALFRVFDIVKPPPVRQLDRIHGGWGVSLDDLAAGVLAGICTTAALWIIA